MYYVYTEKPQEVKSTNEKWGEERGKGKDGFSFFVHFVYIILSIL